MLVADKPEEPAGDVPIIWAFVGIDLSIRGVERLETIVSTGCICQNHLSNGRKPWKEL